MSRHRWQRLRAWLRVPVLRSGFLVAILAATAAVSVVWGYWRPLEDRRARAEAQVVGLNRAISGTEARLRLTDRYLDLAQWVDALDNRLGADVDRSALVERMTALAARADTRIIHGANSFGTERAGVVPVIQDLTVEGSYQDVRMFLDLVAGLDTLTLLLKVDFSANPEGTQVRGQMQFMTLLQEGT